MVEVDLHALSFEDLKQLSNDINKEIKRREQQNKKSVLAEMKTLAASIGMTVEEVLNASGQPKTKGEPKYVNPSNDTETWTGRGKRPRWLNEAIESGKTLDDMRI